MRRIVLTIVCFAALAAPAQAAAKNASVALTACEPGERAAEFEARMGVVKGATRMRMRFTLQVRKSGKAALPARRRAGVRASGRPPMPARAATCSRAASRR